MSLPIDDKLTEMTTLSDSIKTTHSICMSKVHQDVSGGSYTVGDSIEYSISGNTADVVETDGSSWIIVDNVMPGTVDFEIGEIAGTGELITSDKIEDMLDDCILARAIQFKTLSLDKLKELLGNMTDAMQNHGLPCASSGIFDDLLIDETEGNKSEIIDKIANGDMLDSIIMEMQGLLGAYPDCKSLYDKLNEICGMFNAKDSLLSQIFDAIAQLKALLEKGLAVLAAIAAAAACGEELLEFAGASSPWLSEVNSDFDTSLKATKAGKDAFPDNPVEAKKFAVNKAKQDLDLDAELESSKNDMINLNALF